MTLLPAEAAALVRESRTAPISASPLVVEPGPGRVQLWLDAQLALDAAPIEMTLSDGGRWRRDRVAARWELSSGVGIGRLAAALQLWEGVVGFGLQGDVVERDGFQVSVSAGARIVYGAGWDLSLTPLVSWRRPLGARAALVPFVAARLRRGETFYSVQGWDGDHATPYAEATTDDLALAPMAGLALVLSRFELRATAGWEARVRTRVTWEERPTELSRETGPFVLVALRGALRGIFR